MVQIAIFIKAADVYWKLEAWSSDQASFQKTQNLKHTIYSSCQSFNIEATSTSIIFLFLKIV